MKWAIKRFYHLEVSYIDLYNYCRTLTRDFDTDKEREEAIEKCLEKEEDGAVKKIFRIDKSDIEVWDRM